LLDAVEYRAVNLPRLGAAKPSVILLDDRAAGCIREYFNPEPSQFSDIFNPSRRAQLGA
jgi:hypothetical protein